MVQYQDLGLIDVVFAHKGTMGQIQSWQSLVQVCRRWRDLVFAAPRRLNLQLYYNPRGYTRNIHTLDVWPVVIPLLIHGYVHETSVDNVITELGHSDRIHQISLEFFTNLQIENLWTAMQVPFPELAILRLSRIGFSHVPVLPDSFLQLGGSAPCLRYISLDSIPFLGLPNLLLSTTHLVRLDLRNIPHSGYISPDTMATCLFMLSSLEALSA